MDYRLSRVQRYLSFFIGLMLLLFCMGAAMNGGLKGKAGLPVPPIVNSLALCFGSVLGSAVIWRSCRQSAVVSTESPATVQPLNRNPEHLEFQFLLRDSSARLILDTQENRVCFLNCHVPFGLLTSAEEEFSCPTDSIMRVHDAPVANLGMCLTIVTRTGRCVVPRGDGDYSNLYQRLKLLTPCNHPGFLIHDPRMQYPIGIVISGSGVLGLLAGCWAVPMGASNTTLYLFGGLGATFGIAISLLGLWSLDRCLQTVHSDRTTESNTTETSTTESGTTESTNRSATVAE